MLRIHFKVLLNSGFKYHHTISGLGIQYSLGSDFRSFFRTKRCSYFLHSLFNGFYNAPEVHILIEDERNIVVPTYGYGSTTSGDASNTGQRDQITAKTELQIKKPKIGIPQVDENGRYSSDQSSWKGSKS